MNSTKSRWLGMTKPLLASMDSGIRKLQQFFSLPLARCLVLGLFVLQAIILACIVRVGIPPDETTHRMFIEYYANHSLSPFLHDQAPTYNLGDKTREVDYLYHYAMSLVYRLLPLAASGKYVIIRLFSVAAGLGSFLLLARTLKRLGISPGTITFSLLLLSNLPMVLMMSSAINNDAFVWLGTLIGLWLLIRLWEKPTATYVAWLLAVSMAGGLVKRTLVPLGLLFGIIALVIVVRHFKAIYATIRPLKWQLIVACVVLAVCAGLFAERVGGNLLMYHTVTPSCEQVDGAQACKIFWANIRAQTFTLTPNWQANPLPVFAIRWLFESLQNILDIQTQFWLHRVRPEIWLTRLLSCIFIAGLGYGAYYEWNHRRGKERSVSSYRIYIALVCLFFLAVHLFINYQSYVENQIFGLALNGRYIIPSLLPLVGLSVFYWAHLLARHTRVLILSAAVILLLVGLGSGFQLMVRNEQLYKGCGISAVLPANCN